MKRHGANVSEDFTTEEIRSAFEALGDYTS